MNHKAEKHHGRALLSAADGEITFPNRKKSKNFGSTVIENIIWG